MSRRYKGAVISATPPTTTGGEDGSAPGEWTLQSQAQAQGGGIWPLGPQPKYIEDVFSTYLYTGTDAAQTITNGIDLSTKGGMVWGKSRSASQNHRLYDTARGSSYSLISNDTAAQSNQGANACAFNTDGFSLSAASGIVGSAGFGGPNYVSWTFRKQPKFFDVVTYTGNGTSQNIAHSLGSVPGCIVVKATSGVSNWFVYHRSLGNANLVYLNATSASASTTIWNNTDPTSTQFSINGTSGNASGVTYVAYLFADNAGGFGLTGTDNVISCGSFSSNDAANGAVVNLGYEPQWVLIKSTGISDSWNLYDTMRGMPVGSDGADLYPNTSGAETVTRTVSPTATGFIANNGWGTGYNFIYIAIRRGPMKVPTDATKVFTPVTDVSSTTDIAVSTTNQVDMIWSQPVTSVGGDNESFAFDRLRGVTTLVGTRLKLNSTAAEASPTGQGMGIAQNTGYIDNWFYNQGFTSRTIANWTFKRAPSFFDEVCYTGTGSTNYAVTHNLGIAPELMIIRFRNLADNWYVYSKAAGGAGTYLILNTSNALATGVTNRFPTDPTSTQFYVGNALNSASYTSVAYLFATCPGVSKVGSYTGTGATQTISCGFTGGARFVMIKRTDSTGDWYVWDTARGMVSGTDPYLLLNVQSSQVNANNVYTTTGGFQIVSTAAGINASGGTYIFLAIA